MTDQAGPTDAGAPEPKFKSRFYSPFRYPGGKRRLVPYVGAALRANELRPGLFVEPFAGGASVSLELLAKNRVERVALADTDPLVAAFWATVFDLGPNGEKHFRWLVRQVEQIDLDITTWQRMKHTGWRAQHTKALAGLYLNRTSFNGSLYRSAGPIGGMAQSGKYKVGARFPREKLIDRLNACRGLAERVDFVREEDAMGVLRYARNRAQREGWSTFFYLDPPFWAKAKWLYASWFVEADHKALAEQLKFVHEPYLLSYDAADEVAALYTAHRDVTVADVQLFYSGQGRVAGREYVITNLTKLPAETRLFRTNAERDAAREAAASVRTVP
jgi:DNA adenine methylase